MTDNPSTPEERLLALLPPDGGTLGNKAAREALRDAGLALDDEAYRALRDRLLAAGRIVKGRGRGGSIARAQPAENDEKDAETPAPLELEMQAAGGDAAPEQRAKKKKTGRKKPGRRGKTGRASVISYRHDDKRVNNPHVGMVDTTSDGVEEKDRWYYDPHLDPELRFDSSATRARVESLIDDALASGDEAQMRAALEELKRLQSPYLQWTGKAEGTSFEVDTVSLHVHERIDPATILAAVQKRLHADSGDPSMQADLFHAPFENLPLRDAIEFYKHERDWANRLIAGDSLLVMNSLLQKEGMAGQVQMIYIDPPYGIKYGSNFQPFTGKREVKDRSDSDLTQEPEMIKAFRDTWELGIHSYLSYLHDRLLLSRELLNESGSIFVQISDDNLHHVRELLDEIFGAENFCNIIDFQKSAGQATENLGSVSDYLVWYAKEKSKLKFKKLYQEKTPDTRGGSGYKSIRKDTGEIRPISKSELSGADPVDLSRVVSPAPLVSSGFRNTLTVDFSWNGQIYHPGASYYWKIHPRYLEVAGLAGRIISTGSKIYYLRYLFDFPVIELNDSWRDTSPGFRELVFVVQTLPEVIERCILMTTDPGDLVFDPTCGSGTTAYVAEKWGRRWITCDTSRVAVTLAKQRLATASYDYYALKYPQEGLRGGFIYKTVPHITLKSIANNPEIDEIYARMHPAIDEALAALNAALKGRAPAFKVTEGGRKGGEVDFAVPDSKTVELPAGERVPVNALLEWEVPFEFPEDWPAASREPFDVFHAARQAMQRRMDDSIAAHAGQEVLYDQPEVSRDKLRITGPFTVEAVPFATVLGLEEAQQPQDADVAVARSGATSRHAQWRQELIKTGIRGKGGQKLLMDLEPLPGTHYIHAVGTVADSGDRVAVSFGPEYAALEQRQVEIAMREAGELFPLPRLLVFCAFTFDPEAAKDIDNIKGIQAIKAQMNTDLLTEDLKKARSGNESFWLMGQPDVRPITRDDGSMQVEVHGFDYFDTKTGELQSGGKKNIAMWALDTDYDNRSLLPRQVFFPMAGTKDGWYKLKKDIRAELNEDLLEQYHGTVSLPFRPGEHNCIAVKIVDDRGIESLKVIRLDRETVSVW